MSNVLWREIRQTFQRNDRMVFRLIAVNVVVFLGLNLIRIPAFLMNREIDIESFRYDIGLPASLNALLHQPWTLATYMFTHFDFWHILFNLLVFYWFGRILAEFAGNKRILPVYLMGGMAGAVLYITAYNVFPVFSTSINDARAIGASASIMAIVFAAVTLVPDYTMFLLLIGPVKIKWIAVFLVLLDLLDIPGPNAGGHIAHLGGALFGFLYVKQLQQGRDLSDGLNKIADHIANLFRKKSDLKISYRKKEKGTVSFQNNEVGSAKQERIDAILDKISQQGYEALSSDEKEFLFKASKDE